jgi:hypothetical protein
MNLAITIVLIGFLGLPLLILLYLVIISFCEWLKLLLKGEEHE